MNVDVNAFGEGRDCGVWNSIDSHGKAKLVALSGAAGRTLHLGYTEVMKRWRGCLRGWGSGMKLLCCPGGLELPAKESGFHLSVTESDNKTNDSESPDVIDS